MNMMTIKKRRETTTEQRTRNVATWNLSERGEKSKVELVISLLLQLSTSVCVSGGERKNLKKEERTRRNKKRKNIKFTCRNRKVSSGHVGEQEESLRSVRRLRCLAWARQLSLANPNESTHACADTPAEDVEANAKKGGDERLKNTKDWPFTSSAGKRYRFNSP